MGLRQYEREICFINSLKCSEFPLKPVMLECVSVWRHINFSVCVCVFVIGDEHKGDVVMVVLKQHI